jgi:MFS family permease
VIATVASSFEKRRNLAISLVSAGVGVAPLTLSPLVAWLASRYDWRTTLFVVGMLTWAVTLPAVWFVRAAPAALQAGGAGADADANADAGMATADAASPAGDAGPAAHMRVGEALRSRAFIILALAFFCCCAAHSGPIFHTVSYAVGCGLTVTTAVTIYSMEGAAGLGGRLLFGVLADRWGAKPVLVAGLALQGVAATSYLAADQLGSFYAVAVVFGMAYGGTMPLYASLARDAFAPAILGTVLGAATMLSSLGMALGPLIGGWLFDRYGSYVWLYIGSGAMGLAAAAIALYFPTARRQTSGDDVPPLVPARA